MKRTATLARLFALVFLYPSVADCQNIDWTRQFGTSQNDVGRAVGRYGSSVYVGGLTNATLPGQASSGSIDAFLRKYDDSGAEVWTRQFGSSSFEVVYGIYADASAVYVVGEVAGALPGQTPLGERDCYIRKYDPDGNLIWTHQFGTSTHEFAFGVTGDSSGVYVVGYTFGTLPGQTSSGSIDAFIRKYDSAGTQLWTRQFGTSAGDGAFGVAADAGYIYVVGFTGGSLPGQTNQGAIDGFVRKYDANGTEQWTRQFGGLKEDSGQGVAVEGTAVYVSGFVEGTGANLPHSSGTGADAMVRKYDLDGNQSWVRQFGSAGSDGAWSIAADSSGAYAGGYGGALPGQTPLGADDAFVRKYDAMGNEVWTVGFGSTAADGVFGVAVGPAGVYGGGFAAAALPGQTYAGSNDVILVKIGQGNECTPAGVVSWWAGEDNFADTQGLNPGTSGGAVGFSDGRIGRGFRFDQNFNSVVTLPNSPSLQPGSSQLTLEAWIKPDWSVFNLVDMVINKADQCGGLRSYTLALDKNFSVGPYQPGVVVFSASVGGDDALSTTTLPQDNVFHHLAGTYDGAMMKVYIDGVLAGQKARTGPIPTTVGAPLIGKQAVCGDRSSAVIDEVKIYNRALSAVEIQGIFSAAQAGRCGGSPVDTTVPVISCGTADSSWHPDNVQIACTASDGGSGLADPADASFDLSTAVVAGVEDANASTGSRQVCDVAGNCATAGPVTGNKIDRKTPTLTCAEADGLWHPDNVQIACTAADGGSGLVDSASFSLGTTVAAGAEDANVGTGTANVCDIVGNCTLAGPVTGNKIDRKSPAISITAPNGSYLLNSSVLSAFSCEDAGSGLANCESPAPSGSAINTAAPGSHSFSVTATDAVGNSTTLARTYQVTYAGLGSACLGQPGHQVLPPVNADGSSVFKAGRTIPVKFRVCDAQGNSISTAGVVSSFRLIQTISGTVTLSVDESVASTTPDTAFRWDASDQQWIYNVSTSGLAADRTYVYRIYLNDGTYIDFMHGLR